LKQALAHFEWQLLLIIVKLLFLVIQYSIPGYSMYNSLKNLNKNLDKLDE